MILSYECILLLFTILIIISFENSITIWNIKTKRFGTRDIGLIAQEVEFIIPEVVGESEMDKIKYISYGPLVGLLIEAIKQLNNKVNNLENILKNNNLN